MGYTTYELWKAVEIQKLLMGKIDENLQSEILKMYNHKIGDNVVYIANTGFQIYGTIIDIMPDDDLKMVVDWKIGGTSIVLIDKLCSGIRYDDIIDPIIYTSYFGNIRNMTDNVVPIAISLMCPKGYAGLRYRDLAPDEKILFSYKENSDILTYVEQYTTFLYSNFNAKKIINDLYAISGGKTPVMICYEKPGSFCHRNIVAQWLTDNNFPAQELKK